MNIKSIIVAHKAQANPQMGGAIEALGIFDNLVQPLFPIPMAHLSIIITIDKITKPTIFEVRISDPNGELMTKGEFQPMVDAFGVGKKILDLEKFLVPIRGRYTVEVLEKVGEGKFKFIGEETLFIADYPPQRPLTAEDKERILSDESLIKIIRTEFQLPGVKEKIKLQHSLEENIPLEDGFITIPEDNKITVEGREYDLLGVRRHLEWMFGMPIPKQEEEAPVEDQKLN